MTKPETDAEFLKRIVAHRAAHGVVGWLETDWPRLLRLAERGAKVPDEPTEEMINAGAKAICRVRLNDGDPNQRAVRWNGHEMEDQDFPAWWDDRDESRAAITASFATMENTNDKQRKTNAL